MNKTTALAVIAALALPSIGFSAYPSLEEAIAIFPRNEPGCARITPCDHDVRQLFGRMQIPTSPENCRAVESVVLDYLKTINVNVSTNALKSSCGIESISQPWLSLLDTQLQFMDFSTNATECLSLARYVGGVKKVDFPTNLALAVMPTPIMVSMNGYHISPERKRQVELANKRKEALRAQLGDECELQIRVFRENCAVEGYRRKLFAICARGVAGCMGVMDADDFTAFTNQVVTVSGANEQERKVLFKYIAPTSSPSLH